MMTQATAGPNDRRARLVGEDAYVAAGGRIERDLFSEESGERWLDLPLLEELAAGKMEALAEEKTAELGLAWVRPTLESWVPYEITAGLQRIVPGREPLTAEEEERIVAAEAEIDGLISLIDAEDTPDEERREAEAKVRELDREIERLRDKPPIIDEELGPRLGAFLILDDNGEARLDRVFYAEVQAEPEAEGGERSAGQSVDGDVPAAEANAGDQPKPLSRTLIDELAIQRRDILAATVGADPEVALDLATFLMVDRDAVLSSESSGSSLLAHPPSDPVSGFKTPEARATVARTKMAEGLDRSWTSGGTRSERFDAFRALPKKARAAWLAHAVARTLEASANVYGERRCGFHDHLGQLLGIDVAKWWRPTGANYFDRVPKAMTLAALEEVGGPSFASRYAGMKKAELSQSAERIFAGEVIADVDVKEKALAWVPEAMRFAVPEPSVADAGETPPWEDEPADCGEQSGDTREESEGSGPELDGDESSESIEEAA
jgi:ParB family chromosome partitioning protein